MRILPLLALLLVSTPAFAAPDDAWAAKAQGVLKRQPIIDGHNDWPEQLRGQFGEKWWGVDLTADSRKLANPLHTDIPRLHQGRVGGQFWSVWVPANVTGPAAVKATLEQIDIVRGLTWLISTSMPMRFISWTTALPNSDRAALRGGSLALSAQSLWRTWVSVM